MIATGTANWAKVLPHQMVTNDQYRDYNYWSIDLEVSDEDGADPARDHRLDHSLQ